MGEEQDSRDRAIERFRAGRGTLPDHACSGHAGAMAASQQEQASCRAASTAASVAEEQASEASIDPLQRRPVGEFQMYVDVSDGGRTIGHEHAGR
jgi:hypothetical protein